MPSDASSSTRFTPTRMGDWTWLRQQMPVHSRWGYFDHAAVAPLPEPTRAALRRWLDEAAEQGDVAWPRWAAEVERVRAQTATMLAVDEAEIALARNTTEGIGLVAEGFPWREGDNVVFAANDFPSNRFAWLNLASRGVEPRAVPSQGGIVDPAELAQACDARTRLVAVSWVDYLSGRANDLAALVEIAHAHGGYFFLDAIQGLGVLPLDVRGLGIDFLAADGHKWLLGPEGAGIAYIRRELLPMLRPLMVGWHSAVGSSEFGQPGMRLKETAARYEGGTYPVATFLGLAASLELLLAVGGPARIGPRLQQVASLAREKLRAAGANIHGLADDELPQSGILLFELPGQNPTEIRRRCLQQGVVVSCRGGHVRLSPHAYCNEEDLDRLAFALGAESSA